MGIFDLFKNTLTQQKPNATAFNPSPQTPVYTSDIIPIEKRIAGQPPTCDGLYPHEILVLSYAPSFLSNSINTFAGFWAYKYGIMNVTQVLNSLAGRGLIQPGSLMDAVNMEKLPLIKEELKKRNQKVSGKKEELVNRLLESASEAELNPIFPKRPFTLTYVGQDYLKKYEWIPYIHSHTIEDLDIWNLTAIMQTPPFTNYRDKIWQYLNQRGIAHAQAGNFGLYRNSRLAMANFVEEEGKSDAAFPLLCEVALYDLSGLPNSFNPAYLNIYINACFPYANSVCKIPPTIIEKIKKYGSSHNLPDNMLHQQLLEQFSKYQLPFRIFSDAECADIVMLEIYGNVNQLSVVYQNAEARLKSPQRKSPFR